MPRSYEPNSPDALFSRIIQRLDDQDKTLDKILAQTTKTNGRVTSLESKWKQAIAYLTGFTFLLSLAAEIISKFWK